MGIRKNAKFLDTTEQENFVRACILMKDEIVNPAAAPADRYSRWDELVAIHRMIQSANFNAINGINFGHGGTGAFSFLSWHRYFLYRFEAALQVHVPGVMLPYWDWTDPAPMMTDTFLGPDGDASGIVTSGYFAGSKPGTGGNPTALPGWWPATLDGFNLANGWGTLSGPLKRNLNAPSGLPSVNDIREALACTTYETFQAMLEGGTGNSSGHTMHNALHTWFGFPSHMRTLDGSPFDPFFYLHHCNIDRLWAMWQMDGHPNEYPTMGGDPQHHRDDVMYPWVGAAAADYSSNYSFGVIVMPDFSALGAQTNAGTLDHRALGYTYDTMAVIGIGLDATGSMNGLTPDPMTGVGTVTKWEAAKQGVSAFLQDCETVQDSGATYVMAGVKTFRSLAGNDFDAVFPGTPYGLVKNGSGYSAATFDSSIAAVTAFGGTPLADALQDVEDTIVEPPFGWVPSDEPRYLAMLTDGMLTSGSPMSSIADGAFANTAIFAMGFGTPADVDYATLDSVVAKGRTLSFPQVFHGESAGTIDKFYSNALARAIGFTTIFDPVVELFAGEHTHMGFTATSAEEAFLVTAQGMDFADPNWSFQLTGPDGHSAYADGAHSHTHGPAMHVLRRPHVTAKRRNGRLSLVLQRDSAPASTWVGEWTLMIAYRAKDLDTMVMLNVGELMFPVTAGPVRGPRYSRLLVPPEKRIAARAVAAKPRHQFDMRPVGGSLRGRQACAVVVNIYARTRLRLELTTKAGLAPRGEKLDVNVDVQLLAGNVSSTRAYARIVAPMTDIADIVSRVKKKDIPRAAILKGSSAGVDRARILAALEQRDPAIAAVRDEEAKVVQHDHGPMHMHLHDTKVPGPHHLGVYVEGAYCPEHTASRDDHGHEHAGAKDSVCGPDCRCEYFNRVLTLSVAVGEAKTKTAANTKTATKKTAAKKTAAKKK